MFLVKNAKMMYYFQQEVRKVFLAKPGEYEPCGIFTMQHFILLIITLIGVAIALKYTTKTKDVKNIIKKCTIFVWMCELIKISFQITINGTRDLNQYVP